VGPRVGQTQPTTGLLLVFSGCGCSRSCSDIASVSMSFASVRVVVMFAHDRDAFASVPVYSQRSTLQQSLDACTQSLHFQLNSAIAVVFVL
jgi:hypothetical protein